MFAFTQEERRVILFLASVALLGLGINFLAKRYAAVKTAVCLNENIGKVNINKADQDALMIVPGIGRKLAERIIEYRHQNSTFTSVEELQNIKGFKGYRFEKIKGMLYVE
jgi:competence ComEA-like helix-hairpin-helix protein